MSSLNVGAVPERVRTALNQALDEKLPKIKELTEKQMEALLLRLIAGQPTAGFDLVDEVVKARFRIMAEGEGAIYAVLAKMEAGGVIEGEWREGRTRMVKSYRFTANGRARLQKQPAFATELETWVQAVLHTA